MFIRFHMYNMFSTWQGSTATNHVNEWARGVYGIEKWSRIAKSQFSMAGTTPAQETYSNSNAGLWAHNNIADRWI